MKNFINCIIFARNVMEKVIKGSCRLISVITNGIMTFTKSIDVKNAMVLVNI